MRLILALLVAASFVGCAAQSTASRTVGVRSDGSYSAETRSALNGSTAGGPQELVGVYLPFGPFAVKAGLEWDGTTLVLPPIPMAAPAQPSFAPQAQAAPCETTRTVMVPETYMETETRQVPKTRMVPRTIVVPAATIPLPQAAPVKSCPEPVASVCGEACGIQK